MPARPPYINCKVDLALSQRVITMMKLVLLVGLAFTLATGSVAVIVLNPQPAMACPGNGR
jgi:hypothetical protein